MPSEKTITSHIAPKDGETSISTGKNSLFSWHSYVAELLNELRPFLTGHISCRADGLSVKLTADKADTDSLNECVKALSAVDVDAKREGEDSLRIAITDSFQSFVKQIREQPTPQKKLGA